MFDHANLGKRSKRKTTVRRSGRQPVTWRLVQYDPSAGPRGGKNIDAILFYSHREHKGGPFTFLSNFYQCTFRDPEIHKEHEFTSTEQYYQYRKCLLMEQCRVIENDFHPPVPSNEMHHCILLLNDPYLIIEAARSYNKKYKNRPEAGLWRAGWDAITDQVLRRMLYLKFTSNNELKKRLLNTGNYLLAEASRTDINCGIGFRQDEAMDNVQAWGKNRLGEALMYVRKYIQEKEHPGEELAFNHEFWEWELKKYKTSTVDNPIKENTGRKKKARASAASTAASASITLPESISSKVVKLKVAAEVLVSHSTPAAQKAEERLKAITSTSPAEAKRPGSPVTLDDLTGGGLTNRLEGRNPVPAPKSPSASNAFAPAVPAQIAGDGTTVTLPASITADTEPVEKIEESEEKIEPPGTGNGETSDADSDEMEIE